MGSSIDVGNASGALTDDIQRDVEMQRRPTLFHKEPLIVQRSADLLYGGHLVWRTGGGPSSWNITTTYTDTEEGRASVKSAVQNIDLSDYIDPKLSPPNGALVGVNTIMHVAGAKVRSITYIFNMARYSLEYNTSPATSNFLTYDHNQSQSQDADNIDLHSARIVQAVCPIIMHNGIPYLVWETESTFVAMVNANDTYWTLVRIYLMGFYF